MSKQFELTHSVLIYFFISDASGPQIHQKLSMLNTEGMIIAATMVFQYKLKKGTLLSSWYFSTSFCQPREHKLLC